MDDSHTGDRREIQGEFLRPLQEVILESCAANAGRVAVIDPDRRLTYGDLAGLSARLAERVVDFTGSSPARIGLMFDQDASYLVALVAALRAGCTYVPLDHRRGPDWNSDAVSRTGCALVLCSDAHAGATRSLGTPAIAVDIPDDVPVDTGISVPRPPGSTACIYFTSGTTGTPKAVCDGHRNLLHNAARYADSLGTTSADRLSLIQAPIFSGTQSTIFMGLTRGCTICSFDVTQRGLDGLAGWLQESGVTMFHSVPSIFRSLARAGALYDAIRLVRIEGDRASHADVRVLRQHFREDCILVNGLGATECGLVRQFFVTRDTPVAEGDLPLGRAVRDMDVTIVGARGERRAQGETGEVVVTSRYLASGYLGDEERTRARFADDGDGRRSYRTGDIGFLDDNGLLWLRGRQDQQIRINGIAVPVEDVEATLSGLPFVSRALVAAHVDRRARTILVAYLLAPPECRPPLEAVNAAIAERLAPSVRPRRIEWLDSLPLNMDGKLDRSLLRPPAAARPDMDTRYVAPRDESERALAAIWQDILEISPIGVFDDLVALGCDSLAIVEGVGRARRTLGLQIDLTVMFERPTIVGILDAAASAEGTF